MTKRFIVLLLSFSAARMLYAQSAGKDSLNLQRNAEVEGEYKVNPVARQQIDFGGIAAPMRMSEHKNWLQPDETLPKVEYTQTGEPGIDSLYRKMVYISLRFPVIKSVVDSMRLGMFTKVGTTLTLPSPVGIPIGKKGARIYGTTISGLNLMDVFEKEYWCVKQRERRERTLTVLRYY